MDPVNKILIVCILCSFLISIALSPKKPHRHKPIPLPEGDIIVELEYSEDNYKIFEDALSCAQKNKPWCYEGVFYEIRKIDTINDILFIKGIRL